MWKLKPGVSALVYEELRQGLEAERDAILKQVREDAGHDLRRLFLEYHEEVPGEESSEPTYPLRGGAEWKG